MILIFMPKASIFTKGVNKTDNKSDEQFIIMQATIEANGQDFDEKTAKLTEDLKAMIKSTIT